MNRADFLVKEMDCGAEEQIIRSRLAGEPCVSSVFVDLTERRVTVLYEDGLDTIRAAMDSLGMGASFLGAHAQGAAPDEADAAGKLEDQRRDARSLRVVLIINFSFFVVEMVTGVMGRSMGLLADSLDMLADASVYGLALFAVAASLTVKKRVARLSGMLQALLAALGFLEVIRRFFDDAGAPDFYLMMGVSLAAFLANSVSLVVLGRSKSREVHIRASQIFTSNDMIANLGVIAAGVLVLLLNSQIPDLLIGTAVFALVLRGAIRILRLSR